MSAEQPEITGQRQVKIERRGGAVEWHVDEFDGGERVMLIVRASNGGVQLSAHFSAEQWAEFQKLIAGGRA